MNALAINSPGLVCFFILGAASVPVFFFTLQPIFDFFIRKRGRGYTLREKNWVWAACAALFLFAGLLIGLFPVQYPGFLALVYCIQGAGLAGFACFQFLALYFSNHKEKWNRPLVISLAAAGLVAVFLPVILNVPSYWFLGGFFVLLPVFMIIMNLVEKKSIFWNYVSGAAEMLVIASSLFIPFVELQLFLFSAAILFFLIRGERLFTHLPPVYRAGPREAEEVPFLEMVEIVGPEPAEAPDKAVKPVPHRPNPFIPKEFLDILKKETVMDLKLGDHVIQEMTIFFSDIRQFTELFENLTPEESFKFINSYLTRIVPVIEEHGGFVDKYIGDAILALFPQENGADMAVRSAIEIQKRILEYNVHRAKCGYKELQIGIGLHTGTLMLGVIGVYNRMQNTVISDSVNLASRVEGLTKAFNVSMAISGQTFKKLEHPESYMFRYLGNVKVKGKGKPTAVYEVLDGIDQEVMEKKKQTNRFFEEGMLYFNQKNYGEALINFDRVLEILPDDGASRAYKENCEVRLKEAGLVANE
jgi:class 3 adenylate cyclase